MSDILITHSYFLKFDPKEYRAMMPYAPLGTLYAAAVLQRDGYRVTFADSMLAGSEQHIIPYLETNRPRFFIIYDDDFNYLTKMCLSRMREAAFVMAGIARGYGCTVIVHGSDPVDHAASYFEHGVDFVIHGEGEITLRELVPLLESGAKEPFSIPGIMYPSNGEVVSTGPRPVLKDLDALPLPARELVDMEPYRSAWIRHQGYFSMNVVTTRGCPFHCNWCAKPLYGQVYHSRSPVAVAEEFARLKKDYQPDHIWVCDDIFGLKPGWIASFASELGRLDAHIPFKCLGRADLLLRGNTVDELKRAGCVNVWLGAESGSQKILDAMDKGTSVAQIHEATRRLRNAGIQTGFFIQYGYPGETRDDITSTLKMITRCRPDQIGISVSYPLPGTPFYNRVRDQMKSKTNWEDSEDLAMLYRGTFVPEFYRKLHKVTHSRHRISLGLNQASSLLARPAFPDRKSMRAMAAAGYHLPRLLFNSMLLKYYQSKKAGDE